MKTRLFTLPDDLQSEEAQRMFAEAGDCIRQGGLVAFPTETVYGLGGNAFDKEAAKKIYAAKGRPSDNPLIVHIAKTEDIERLAVDIPKEAFLLAERFWPGPMTLVLQKRAEVPLTTTGGLHTVAVRLPKDTAARELIREAGGFVAAPSANVSGRPSPTTAAHCLEDLDGRVDIVIDGGSAVLGLESTVVDMTVFPPVVLRPGFVTAAELEEALGLQGQIAAGYASGAEVDAPKAPGMKYRHYAPKGTLRVVEGTLEEVRARISAFLEEDRKAGIRTGVFCAEELAGGLKADYIAVYGHTGDSKAYAKTLFQSLREMDAHDIAHIYAQGIDAEGVGEAAMNRLRKAAGAESYKEEQT